MSLTWEQWYNVARRVYNRQVDAEFKDVDLRTPIEELDYSVPRNALYRACRLHDSDSAPQASCKMMLFYFGLGHALEALPLYTMPTDRYQQQVKFAPQVTLYFKEDLADVEQGYAPIDAEISFRIKNESYSTITENDLRELAREIRSEFATGSGYRWRKGRLRVNYRDLGNGYLLSLSAYSEQEGREVIRKILSLQEHTLDDSKLTINHLGEAPPIVPPNQMIYGHSRRPPRKRPVGYVRFIYAEVHIWGLHTALTLIDRSGRRKNPILPLS